VRLEGRREVVEVIESAVAIAEKDASGAGLLVAQDDVELLVAARILDQNRTPEKDRRQNRSDVEAPVAVAEVDRGAFAAAERQIEKLVSVEKRRARVALASFSDEELGRIGRLDAESTSSAGC